MFRLAVAEGKPLKGISGKPLSKKLQHGTDKK